MEIGIISDTHSLIRDEALHALRGVDAIIHAGDIGHPQVLEALDAIAPLTFIKGNIDCEAWALDWPDTATFRAGGHVFHVVHNIQELNIEPGHSFSAIIYGHSHQPKIEWRSAEQGARVLYFNPGSAGPRRFKLPISLGRLRITRRGLEPRLIELPVTAPVRSPSHSRV